MNFVIVGLCLVGIAENYCCFPATDRLTSILIAAVKLSMFHYYCRQMLAVVHCRLESMLVLPAVGTGQHFQEIDHLNSVECLMLECPVAAEPAADFAVKIVVIVQRFLTRRAAVNLSVVAKTRCLAEKRMMNCLSKLAASLS